LLIYAAAAAVCVFHDTAAGPNGFDCVVIAGSISNIADVITRIIPLASSSATFCVFHPNIELLVNAQFLLQQRSDVVLCSVTGCSCCIILIVYFSFEFLSPYFIRALQL
jgi:hypothetical protein